MRRTASALALALLLSSCAASVTEPTDFAENSSSTVEANGTLVIQGSDTEVQLVSNLAEAFTEVNADADLSVTGGGSAVGIASLINGTTDIANSSRAMNEEEIAQAEAAGVEVKEIVLARDALSIVVHPSNPVTTLTTDVLGRIYRGEIINWNEIGGPDAKISLYGRQSTSGTFGYFRDAVLQADYAASMRQMEGTQAIVDAVSADVSGIGYVGVGYLLEEGGARERVHTLTLSKYPDSEPVSPFEKAKVLAGDYALARPIYQYVDGTPAADGPVAAFLNFELSAEGQALVEESGFYPVTTADSEANAAALKSAQQ